MTDTAGVGNSKQRFRDCNYRDDRTFPWSRKRRRILVKPTRRRGVRNVLYPRLDELSEEEVDALLSDMLAESEAK